MAQLKRCFLILLLICISMTFGTVSNATSVSLLEVTAEAKLKTLMTCIKSHENDISLCLENFTDFLKAQIKLVKAAPDEKQYKTTLDKMVDYLKNSTDIFYQKARNTKSLKYYEKSSRCADLLLRLSDKYKKYGEIVQEFENFKRGTNATSVLTILYNETTKYTYPNTDFQNSFNSLVEKSIKRFEYLEEGFQNDLIVLGNQLIAKYIAHMRSIVSELESFTIPVFGTIAGEYKIYKIAIKIPNVNTHEEESLSLRKKVGTRLEICLNKLKRFEAEEAKKFIGGENILISSVETLAHLGNIILVSSEHVKPKDDLFLDVPAISNEVLNHTKDLKDFLQFTLQAKNELENNSYVKAVNLWEEALSIKSVDRSLRDKAQVYQFTAIQAAVDQALTVAKNLADEKKFAEALKELKSINSSVPVNMNQRADISNLRQSIEKDAEIDRLRKIQAAVDQALTVAKNLADEKKFAEALKELKSINSLNDLNQNQKKEIASLRNNMQNKGQLYVLRLAKKLKSSGQYMQSLRTIDMAKEIGMNDDLNEFFNNLKEDFDWKQITNIEDCEYFVNCPLDKLVYFMKFPKKAGSDNYCFLNLEISNQVDTDGYYGYLGGEVEYPVYAKIINSSLKGATLSNKTILCLFRINGTEELVDKLTNTKVNVPYLEIVFIQ